MMSDPDDSIYSDDSSDSDDSSEDGYLNIFDYFTKACADRNKEELEEFSVVLNALDQDRCTGLLMEALDGQHYSITRWLLEFPKININIRGENNMTALHFAFLNKKIPAPFDIIVKLCKMSDSLNDVMESFFGEHSTALDLAVEEKNTAGTLHLSWLGAQCREENKNCYFTASGTGGQTEWIRHSLISVP